MKKYTFKVTITEGQDEFWESIQGSTGCDEVESMVITALVSVGLVDGYGLEVKLISFEDDDEKQSNVSVSPSEFWGLNHIMEKKDDRANHRR